MISNRQRGDNLQDQKSRMTREDHPRLAIKKEKTSIKKTEAIQDQRSPKGRPVIKKNETILKISKQDRGDKNQDQ